MMVATTSPKPRALAQTPPPRWGLGCLVASAVALLMLAPALGRGFVLKYDMVFVPAPAINARSLGLDGSVPRAVPMDFLVALVSRVVPADLVQTLLLIAIPVVGVLGMWGLLRHAGLLGQLAGALAFSWNVYVYERLVLGHWSLLVGVALLPWVLAAALAVRRDAAGATRRLIVLLGIACVTTPTTGLLAVAVAVGVLGTRWRATGLAVASGALFSAPWWVPGLVAITRGAPDPAGVDAFAVRSDSPLGPLGSLLTFGGIWNGSVVPPGRDTWPVALAALVVLGVAAFGVAGVGRSWGKPALVGLAVVAGLGLALAAVAVLPGGAPALRRVLVSVPALGLVRDAQKLVAPWLLLVSCCFGFGVARLARIVRLGTAARPVAVVLALLPVALVPGLALGAGGRFASVQFPADYVAVQRFLVDSAAPGDVVVLPWHLYRSWTWNDRRIALDPTQRLLQRTTVVRDDLELADRSVAGEDPRVPPITAALAAAAPLGPTLGPLGIGFVLVDRDTLGGPVDAAALAGLQRVYAGADLELYAVPGTIATRPARFQAMILTVDGLAVAAWLAALVSFAFTRRPALLQFWRRREENAP